MWQPNSPQGGTTAAAATRRLAWLALVIGCLTGLALGAKTLDRALERLELPRPRTQVDALVGLLDSTERLSRLGERERGRQSLIVPYLADSTALAGSAFKPLLPPLLASALREALAPRKVYVPRLVQPGIGAFTYLMMSGRIAEAAPDLVLVSFNAANYSEVSRENFSRPALSGLALPSQLPALAGLPLSWSQLTYDQVLKNMLVVKLGWARHWRRLAKLQVRLIAARASAESALYGRTGPEARYQRALAMVVVGSARGSGDEGALGTDLYGAALAGVAIDHPVHRALAATIETLRQGGAQVVVYLTPLNVERLRAEKLVDEAMLARTRDNLRRVVEGAGGRFVDLHDLLPADGYRDAVGHYSADRGAPQLATALVDAILQALRAAER